MHGPDRRGRGDARDRFTHGAGRRKDYLPAYPAPGMALPRPPGDAEREAELAPEGHVGLLKRELLDPPVLVAAADGDRLDDRSLRSRFAV